MKRLAPNWDEFNRNRKTPLVYIFGASKNTWRRAWRTNFLKETFWKVRKEEEGIKRQSKKDKVLEDSFSKPSPKKEWLSTKELSERKGEFLKGETWQYKPRWEDLKDCPRCGKPLIDDKRNNQIVGKRCKNCKGRFFQTDLTGRRRQLRKSQPQGQLLVIHPKDGPPRVVNAENVAEGICLSKRGNKYSIRLQLQPAIARLLKSDYYPPLVASDELQFPELRRNALIKLPELRKELRLKIGDKPACYPAAAWPFIRRQEEDGNLVRATFVFPDGYYRVKELSLRTGAEVWHESIAQGVTTEHWCCPLENKARLSPEEVKSLSKSQKVKFPERKLGITELRKLVNSKSTP